LGMAKIKSYLKEFDYGYYDFSGHQGRHDGLTTAWLSSSLKISANEQLSFIEKLISRKLPVSSQAIQSTEDNMFIGCLKSGWELYGKTGSGYSPERLPEGWFVGFLIKGKQKYIFVTNYTDNKTISKKSGGLTAKNITLKLLKETGERSKIKI